MMGMGGMAAPMPEPGMGGDPMHMDPMGGEQAEVGMTPVQAVLAALQVMQAERKTEDDVVLQAVMAATGGVQNGLGGVTEGAPMGMPGAAPEMGAY